MEFKHHWQVEVVFDDMLPSEGTEAHSVVVEADTISGAIIAATGMLHDYIDDRDDVHAFGMVVTKLKAQQ